jgi:hypothetical protein
MTYKNLSLQAILLSQNLRLGFVLTDIMLMEQMYVQNAKKEEKDLNKSSKEREMLLQSIKKF